MHSVVFSCISVLEAAALAQLILLASRLFLCFTHWLHSLNDPRVGLPFSADMGTTVWRPDEANQWDWAPEPLVEGTDVGGFRVIEQPAALQNLSVK